MQEKEINIVSLSDRESCQTRQGMYIGSNENCNVLLREAVDNALDEVYGCSYCDTITLKDNYPDGIRVISDNGRCIPILWDDSHKMTKCEMATSILHAGSKFTNSEGDMSIGANGVGISCTNFLSEEFFILSRIKSDNYSTSIKSVSELYESSPDKDNLYYILHYSDGLKSEELALNKYDAISMMDSILQVGIEFPDNASTVVVFKPHPGRFLSVESSYPINNLRNSFVVLNKFYNKRLNFYLNGVLQDAVYEPKKYEFTTKVKVADRSADFYISFDVDPLLNLVDITGSVNSLRVNAGLHVQASKQAYEKALKSIYNITHNNIVNGLHMDVFTISSLVDYTSQTKSNLSKLNNLSITDIVKVLEPEFRKIIKDNSEVFDLHVERLNTYAESLSKISAIQKVKNLISTVGGNTNKVRSKLPKNVKDCTTGKRSEAELFICEGRSASGNIIRTRDPRTQSVFELRGVPLNTVGLPLDDIMQNEECRSIITAIGGGVDSYHNKDQVRYGKIIITCDADVDGRGKIAPLILGLICSQMKYLIDMGCVYVLDSPLYKQGGKYYYLDDLSGLDFSKPFKRFKGLGELTQQEAYETITNKSTRRLIQITIDNLKDTLLLLSRNSGAKKELMRNKGQLIDKYNTGII